MTEKPVAGAASLSQLLIDLGPVAIFVVAYNILQRFRPEDAVYIATAIFIVATIVAIIYCRATRGKIPPVLIVTGVLVTAFGGLTLVLHNPTFIQLKPTFLYLFYAVAIGGSVLIRQNVWKLFFGHIFVLPDRIWAILALRWAAFFAVLAVLNEVIRRTQSMEFWVNSRILVFFPLILLFGVINAPLTLKHSGQTSEAPAEPQ
ncbi:MAG TPA: inner membrane-spanning protein YciB [Caulobacterales bacterium]|nr:inner membrane-spanning protein YciB [Caulobacterales bacterium]